MKPIQLIYSILIYLFIHLGASASDKIYSAKEILLNLEVGSFHNSLSEGVPGEYKNHKTFKETEFTHGEYDKNKYFSLTNNDKSWMISLKIIGIKNDMSIKKKIIKQHLIIQQKNYKKKNSN